MDHDRSALIEIGGIPYRLVLTTKATKEIAKRYGGLEKLGDKLMKAESFELALEEIIWLITLLANQNILRENYLAGEKKPLLTEEAVELMTTPFELSAFKDAIMKAMYEGMKRHVQSEETSGKNV